MCFQLMVMHFILNLNHITVQLVVKCIDRKDHPDMNNILRML